MNDRRGVRCTPEVNHPNKDAGREASRIRAAQTDAFPPVDNSHIGYPLVYRWGNNEVRVRLRGRRCRIIGTGRMNSVLLEFERDGVRIVTSRYAVVEAR